MKNSSRKVPSSRFSRLAHLGGLAGQVASNMLLEGAKQAFQGKPIKRTDLLLQSKNIHAVAKKLSHLRGAAMKLGQLLSMDAGDLLPPELAMLLSHLRSDAMPMPHKQLVGVLEQELGQDWLDKFSHIELKSFAQASIGQVHRANTESGQPLAIKIQYPGVAKSIQSDVDNVASLIKMTGLLPKGINIAPLIAEAKSQLLAETNYQQEADHLQQFARGLEKDTRFKIPLVYPSLSSQHLLTMEYVNGEPLAEAVALPQPVRNNIVTALIELFFIEMFELKLIQTDPNFANYLFNKDTHKIVLLDFGATRVVSDTISSGYKNLLRAAMEQNHAAVKQAACNIGYFDTDISPEYCDAVIELFLLATTPLRCDSPFDFANSQLSKKISEKGLALNNRCDEWHTPPVDALFIHRKLAGLYLIAAKLQAKVDLTALQTYLK
ncbi:AarF/ABC1/UbiB kinase family protein [Pseudoalteromonas sp. GCY]|uniref:ABC1 kinase family protein n=1 Tax=Pseudoalteromonas sp. GCY TaxID=2003316 RepID=UPI001F4034AF|nr:AarF/ABC1/UbiB kinase family protein [Pseudoalteromonas sp. GCY]